MPLDSASYVERASDKALLQALSSGRYCYVLNSRQMGKSSLSVRVMSRLREDKIGAVLIDLTRIGGRNVTAIQWYAGLCDEVGGALGLRSEMMAYFRSKSELSPLQRFFGAIDEVLLEQGQGRIVILIDEIDATRNLNFDADEFFAGIRECYNRRVQDSRFGRLAFCLIGVAVPTDLIRDPSTTPFNIGERIELSDFSLEEMAHLAEPLGPAGKELIERVHHWTGGQPFLTQSLCEAISRDPGVKSPADVDQLVNAQLFDPKARTTNINLADVSNRALHSGSAETDPGKFQADLLTAYERIWRGGSLPDDESNRVAVMLKLSGLTRSDGRRLSVRNRIYRHVFDRTWVRENMPNRELMREKQAFRRGIARAATASAAVVGIVAVFGVFAWNSKQKEVEARSALDYELYVADMNNMRLLEETGDVARMKELLVRTSNSPSRGFEWSFWQRRIHDSDEEYTLDYSAPGKREEGILSVDGKQICIYDSLAGIAVVVDRRSKKTIFTRQIGAGMKVIALPKGFVAIEINNLAQRIHVSDLETGKIFADYAPKGFNIGSYNLRPRSKFILAGVNPGGQSTHGFVLFYDFEQGKALWKKDYPGSAVVSPMMASSNGERLLYSLAKDPAFPEATKVAAYDSQTGETKMLPDLPTRMVSNDFRDLSESGRYTLYEDPQLGTVCWDLSENRFVSSHRSDGPDRPTESFFVTGDKLIASLYGNGRAELTNLRDGAPAASIRQVWELNQSNDPDHVIASSTSVRIVSIAAAGNGSILGAGIRAMRNGKGEIGVWRGGANGIDFYRDPDLGFVAHHNALPNQRQGYTYNGRWVTVGEPGKDGAWIVDAEGKQPAFHLSTMPVNFSCGIERNLMATLERPATRIDGISGVTGQRLWSYARPTKGVTSLWVSPDGKNVLAGIGETDLIVLDGATGKFRTRFDGHNVKLSNLNFTSGGKLVFTCGADGRAILWNLVTGKRVREFKGNVAQRIASADLSPDGTRVATCNLAGAWQLWDARSGVQMMEIQASSSPLRSILFTADGRSVITAGDDGQVRNWPILDGDPTVRIPVPEEFLTGIRR